MRYFARRWDETRGDGFDDWGCSWWYFETDGAGYVLRQIERYDGGAVLRYDESRLEDEHGKLSEAALDLDEFAAFEITAGEFEEAWALRPNVPDRPPRMTEIEVLSAATSAAVVRVPGRRFPGIVIQGDTLSTLCDDATEIAGLARSSGHAALAEAAEGLRDRLDGFLRHYVAVLDAHGHKLPFVRDDSHRKTPGGE